MWRLRVALKDRRDGLIEKTDRRRTFLRQHIRLFISILALGIIAFLLLQFHVLAWLPAGFEEKTWWDVFELLFIPLVLAGAAVSFNSSAKRREERAADNRRQVETLRTYLDRMGELLIDKGLLKERDQKETPVSDYARAITVAALRNLDKDRRNDLLQFLRDAGLSDFLLSSAVLDRTNLAEANLWDFNLSSAKLSDTVLDKANLERSNLSDCILGNASLMEANIMAANIHETLFINCNLQGSLFCGSDLTGSNLSGSDLRGTNFDQAILRATIFSDDEKHLYADVERASFVRANLSAAHLSGVNLLGANLDRANLTDANLVKTNVSGVNFNLANLSYAAFTGARGLTEEQLLRAILKGTRMPSGILRSNPPANTAETA